MKLIAFTGLKDSGKDTAAAAFVQAGHTHLKFADGLKEMLRAFLRYQGEPVWAIDAMLDGDCKERQVDGLADRTPRHAMQTLGTEWGRQMLGPNIWVDATMRRAEMFDKVVISDVRFENEVAAVKAAGGQVYRVTRPDIAASDTHSSEAHIPLLPVDGEFQNHFATADEFTDYIKRSLLGSTFHPAVSRHAE